MSAVDNYPLSIPALIGEVVTAVRTAKLATLQEYDSTIQTIGYMHGNLKEVTTRLQEMSNNTAQRFSQYPLFILIEDITVDRRNTKFWGIPNMTVIIANHTKKDYNSTQRETINFVPILRPLYQEFLYQMYYHTAFSIQSERLIPHNMTERKYWGADDNTVNVLGKYIDAIEISSLQVPIKWGACNTSITDY